MVYNKLGGKMNRPPIKIDCLKRPLAGINAPYDIKGGEAWNYLTPEQWEAETGEKMLETDRVWVFLPKFKQWWPLSFDQFLSSYFDQPCIIARAGQPKPPEGYRP